MDSLKGQIIENCKFLFKCDPIILTRAWDANNMHHMQILVVERYYSSYVPFDSGLEATGVHVEYKQTWTDYYSSYTNCLSSGMEQLLLKTEKLVHEKIAKQSSEATGVAAEVEQTFLRLTVGEEDEEFKTRFRKRLLRRAFDDLHCKQLEREKQIVNRMDELEELLYKEHEEAEQEKKCKAGCEKRKAMKREQMMEKKRERRRLEEEERRRLEEEERRRLAEEERLENERLAEEERLENERLAREERDLIAMAEELQGLEQLEEEERELMAIVVEQQELERMEEMAREQEKLIASKVSLAVKAAEERAQRKYQTLEKLYGTLTFEHCQMANDTETMKAEAKVEAEAREKEHSFTKLRLEQKLAESNAALVKAQEKARVDVEREKGFRKSLEAAIDVFRHTEAERVEELKSLRKELELTKSQLEATTVIKKMQEQGLRRAQKDYLGRASHGKGPKKASYIKRAEDIGAILRHGSTAITEEGIIGMVNEEDSNDGQAVIGGVEYTPSNSSSSSVF
ncbi:hypothetical protein BDD12DRAFT_817163 [Trichophaea hybrida]|nr:hypothetical protein BDD12DRAFT_817163 [Trichophaea hybrida]